MSNWQTAKINSVEGNSVQLTLALRDREQRVREYDEETGQRVWGKFEMPDSDAEDEDDGVLELDWSELLEPKLVRP